MEFEHSPGVFATLHPINSTALRVFDHVSKAVQLQPEHYHHHAQFITCNDGEVTLREALGHSVDQFVTSPSNVTELPFSSEASQSWLASQSV